MEAVVDGRNIVVWSQKNVFPATNTGYAAAK